MVYIYAGRGVGCLVPAQERESYGQNDVNFREEDWWFEGCAGRVGKRVQRGSYDMWIWMPSVLVVDARAMASCSADLMMVVRAAAGVSSLPFVPTALMACAGCMVHGDALA